jgi:GNAT superfamily N-acetyltransferase
MSTSLQFLRSSEETDRAELVREMMALDRELYHEATEDDLGGFDYWMDRFAICPDSMSIARQSDRVLAGYYQFLPITAAYCEVVLAGRGQDGQIPLDAIVSYQQPGKSYHLLLCSMAVRPMWRGRGVASRLYREEAAFQRRLRLDGFQAQSLVSVVWSDCGARFFERIRLPEVGRDKSGRPIHAMRLRNGMLPELPAPHTVLPPAPIRAAA